MKAANQSRRQCLQHLIWQHPLIYQYILFIYLLFSHFSRTSKLLHSKLWGSLFNCKFKKHQCQRLFNYGTEPNKNNHSLILTPLQRINRWYNIQINKNNDKKNTFCNITQQDSRSHFHQWQVLSSAFLEGPCCQLLRQKRPCHVLPLDTTRPTPSNLFWLRVRTRNLLGGSQEQVYIGYYPASGSLQPAGDNKPWGHLYVAWGQLIVPPVKHHASCLVTYQSYLWIETIYSK